jgi:hypothetical protein
MTTRAALTPAGLAGDPALAGMPEGRDVVVARSERHAIVVRTGPRPLRRLLQADLHAALEGLEIA